MSRSETRQRQRRLVIRMTEPEWEVLETQAADVHLSLAGYARTHIFPVPPTPRRSSRPPRRMRQPVKDGEALARILGSLGKIGSNVNQLAHAANLNNWPEARLHEEARQDIRAMRDLLMQALGVRQHDHSDHEAG